MSESLYGLQIRTHPHVSPGKAYVVPPDSPLAKALDGGDLVDEEVPDADYWAEIRRQAENCGPASAVIKISSVD